MRTHKIFPLLLLSGLLLPLTGCGDGKNADGKIEIKFINGFTGGDGQYMTKIVKGFNASQKKYKLVQSQEKDHYTKFKSGKYDLVVIHEASLRTYQSDQMIQPVTDYMKQANIKENDFLTSGVDSAKVGNKMYALPLDIHPLTMFYNKNLVKSMPKTYADLEQLNEQLQKKDDHLYAFGLPSSGLTPFYLTVAAAQNDIQLERDGYLDFAQPAYADALMKYHDMIFVDQISPKKLGLDGEFQSFMKTASNNANQTAVSFTGPWYYSAVKDKYKDQLGIGPMPLLFKSKATTGNAHTIAVSSSVQDQEVKKGISSFFKYLYTPKHLANWAESGQTPSHKETLKLITDDPSRYALAAENQKQLKDYVRAPRVYQFDEQMRYMNEVVFAKLTSDRNLTKDALMTELKKATKQAQEIAKSK
ncbi:hypothetical protein [Exiguobacterium sp. 9-2]|uniref:hypothetical protein n=1 Tax=Exiguobacterium sp. 9-2 TaxID=3112419 RepID=UPI002E3771B6|nr:hypothetical protein [Exiguobacterium sp. 9-2]